MKKLLIRAAALILAALLLPSSPALATDSWAPTVPPPVSGSYWQDVADGRRNLLLDERAEFTALASNITINYDTRGFAVGDRLYGNQICDSITTGPCASTPEYYQIQGLSLLPVCGAVIHNCISELSIFKSGEAPVKAKFVRYVAAPTVAEDNAQGIPEGTSRSIWQSTVNHSGDSGEYVVTAALRYEGQKGSLKPTGIDVTVQAVTEKPDPYSNIVQYRSCQVNSRWQVCGNGYNTSCAFAESNICGRIQDFAPGTRIGVKVLLDNRISGWFRGRLSNPNYSVSAANQNFNSVYIEGDAVKVPKFFVTRDTSKGDQPEPNVEGGQSTDGNATQHAPAASLTGMAWVNQYKKLSKDTAAGATDEWSFSTINTTSNGCLDDRTRLLGLVTTNAMAYTGAVPTWDGTTLNYAVAGMHYESDGKTLTQGTYDLVMRSDVARCLYGFSSAPVSATISVIGDGGESKVATTSVNESDGWLHLAAYGFTFSSPTIAVKLTQAAPTPVATPSATPVAKNTTITCIKGKLTKKVSGTAPKCPSGYKKK